ncbi:putative serpin-like protein [Thelohanellus kitauei]|uniref:Putative serpin-like protein n=1 Tax=Thelohanellus kitauei TaxID=669202 RepID=A0A0C2IBJ6_THEKT|nr:putative serpin-like protein [Thelohanellus kitauei]
MSVYTTNKFSSNVFNQLYAKNLTENIVFSGVTMMVGIREKSKDELSEFLKTSMAYLYESKMGLADYRKWKTMRRLFCAFSFLQHIELFSKYFSKINFSDEHEAIWAMNDWVRKHTFGRNRDDFTHTYPQAKMILLSTITLKNVWVNAFNVSKTEEETFYATDKMMRVQMMNHIYPYAMFENQQFRVIFIPINLYKRFAIVVLPSAGRSLSITLRHFTTHPLYYYYDRARVLFIDLKLPKFKLFKVLHLVDTFQHFNVREIFKPNVTDMRGVTKEAVPIHDVIQSSHMVVDEFGEFTMSDDDVIIKANITLTKFHVNKPFLFYICDEYRRTILLSAAINHPNND